MRAGVIVIEEAHVALIERVRGGRRYYLFPGGGVQPGETAETAATRETVEELGLSIALVRPVARATFGGEDQLFFLARVTGGEFGTGRGPEMNGDPLARAGSYRAVWWAVADLATIDLRPLELSAMVQQAPVSGWPDGVTGLAT